MAIQIGQPEPGCNDPVGLMTACHRRIELFLKTLRYAAEHAGGRELLTDEAEAISRSLRYFREAAPHHVADEEQDLFPALARRDPGAADAINRLELDHQRAGRLHARVNEVGERWVRDGRIEEELLREFRNATEELEALYAEHIQVEETEVFPKATRALNETELDAIGRQMALRRGVAYVPKSGLGEHA
ncbi:MAG: hemerythrin domain-containing protein [Bryobacterales bacterium]|nr:hemerythrin domain-containing protein [Bryobacterales bacterium]